MSTTDQRMTDQLSLGAVADGLYTSRMSHSGFRWLHRLDRSLARKGRAGEVFAFLACFAASILTAAEPLSETTRPTVILVTGAAGDDEYGQAFSEWAERWEAAARKANVRLITLTSASAGEADHARLRQLLDAEPKEIAAELWLVLLGHGTFDGREAKFNLRGPDVSASELATWLEPFRRPLAVINAASSSGPFLSKLARTNRVVITAAKSGAEQNFARFGGWLAEAIADPQADLDKDGQTSLLEAYLMASRRVGEFYKSEGRLATEHALLDDNGDGLGTPAEWFRGIRAVKKAKDGASLDGARAHQWHLVRSAVEEKLPPELRLRRDALELEILQWRESKAEQGEDAYYQRLEALFLELAKLNEEKAETLKR